MLEAPACRYQKSPEGKEEEERETPAPGLARDDRDATDANDEREKRLRERKIHRRGDCGWGGAGPAMQLSRFAGTVGGNSWVRCNDKNGEVFFLEVNARHQVEHR